MRNINRKKFHELDMLLWDRHQQYIEPKLALDVYERRWGFVDLTKIDKKEQKLIDKLVNLFGNGCFMPAVH